MKFPVGRVTKAQARAARAARTRIALGSVQSRPSSGVRVPLAGLSSRPTGPRVLRASTLGGASSLGVDELPDQGAVAQTGGVDAGAVQAQLLASSQKQNDLMQFWIDQDKRLRLEQMAVTAAIPVFAWAWRWILGWRRGRIQIL